MQREDIIQLAREAGSIDSEDVIETVYAAFAAAERNECLKVVWGTPGVGLDGLFKIMDAIRARGQS